MSVATRYRKREPIEVDAVQVTVRNISAVAEWCDGRIIQSGSLDGDGDPILVQEVGIKLRTKNRLQIALLGDFIYKDHEDFFHVTKISEFNFEYEPIKENKV